MPLSHAAVAQLNDLRQHQRRLLFGAGALITLLLLATMLASLLADARDVHLRHQREFHLAKEAVDYYLGRRDRAYASAINAHDALWTTQRPALVQRGRALARRFIRQGEQLVVTAEGKNALPWLVLGRHTETMDPALLAAYLGMLHEYSAFTATTVTAVQSGPELFMYAYEPAGRLFAVTGVASEAELLQRLQVSTRAQALQILISHDYRVAGIHPCRGPIQYPDEEGRLRNFVDLNPVTHQPALVGIQTQASEGDAYFRRVTFDSLERIQQRMTASTKGAFLVIDRKGRTLMSSGKTPAAAAALQRMIPAALPADGQPLHLRAGGTFMDASQLQGIDWRLLHFYTWEELLAVNGWKVWLKAAATLSMSAILWTVLLLLDRRVFTPALLNTARVYESQALSRIIIDTTPIGLCLLDAADASALAENAVAGSLAAPVADASIPLYAQLVAQVRGKAGQGQQVLHWVHQGMRLEVSMAPATYRGRAVWVCALHDVTTQHELQRSLQQARVDSEHARLQAESASRAKSVFVATMSHEIRTPLNGVLGHLELLSRSQMCSAQQEHVNRIQLSANLLMGTISDVLDFSRIEAGQLDIDPTPFALRGLVEQVALLYAPVAQRKGIELLYRIDPSLHTDYVADAHRIGQVLNNLVSNAIKFTEHGRVVISILAARSAADPRQRLRFKVEDSGIGITEAQLQRLFEPFLQADSSISRRYGGSGLGLALCQQLAGLLGGRVEAVSMLGHGSVFTLEVPVEPVPAAQPRAQPLAAISVTLLSARAEWRDEFGGLLSALGANVRVIDTPAAWPAGAQAELLLVCGAREGWSEAEEAPLRQVHARVLRALPGGPLVARQGDGEVLLSCYASDALVAAIGRRGLPMPAPAARSTAPASGMPMSAGGRILLAEDNPVNRELIQWQLEELGYRVDAAPGAMEALAQWCPGTHVAVLTDINMPGMNGYDLALALQQRGQTPPILAITASALPADRERCRAAGISELLLKPVGLDVLEATLARHLVSSQRPLEAPSAGAGDDARDRQRRSKMRELFVSTTAEDIAGITEALARQDAAELIGRLHSLAGALLMMAERDTAQVCVGLEQALLQQPAPVPHAAIEALLRTLESLLERYACRSGGGPAQPDCKPLNIDPARRRAP
ncbi:hybrid sensor histidine kinase/response regulator [Stenotrophomonas rhizophila]|uniref:hybrid sensor histidine kinase/response regulator n=1 Tax=Stenotrophomonas rhizophila TaxID=216778 RepID=UPI001E284A88|nr:ATP-binding protein [Stenotrophomonas rhizophila]MCC7634825.1 response regulator [Stenotrophomonas rhizophila]MCC7664502.1 response regulator [Stenotrophomonas rhizophila]